MKLSPAQAALVVLFRRHPGEFLDHAVVYEAGRHNTTARLSELRQMGFTIEQRGRGESSQYAMTCDPFKVPYRTLRCACGWEGSEVRALAATYCPTCGSTLEEVTAVQSDLFRMPA